MHQNSYAVHIFPNSFYFQKFHGYVDECHHPYNFPIKIEKSGIDKTEICQSSSIYKHQTTSFYKGMCAFWALFMQSDKPQYLLWNKLKMILSDRSYQSGPSLYCSSL
jgi:hypothetical protein